MSKHLVPDSDSPEIVARPRTARIAALVAALLLIGAAAAVAGFSIAQQRPPWAVLAAPIVPSPQALFHKDRLLVLAEGLDYDYNAKDEEYSGQSRSDVIMAIDLDFETHRIYELSVPRDMDAVLPNGQEAKINQAQSDGGVAEAKSVIAKWLGVPGFDRYVVLRINTTKDLINAIGGIDIDPMNSDAILGRGPNGPINYDDTWGHLHIHFKPGMQHLNGDQAVSYARFRHDWCSDPCRIRRQQQVIAAFIAKLKDNKLNTLLHMNDLIAVFNRDVNTDFTRQEEVSLALAFADMPKNALHTKQVPYVADKELPYAGDVLIPDEAKKAQLVRTMLLDPPMPVPSPDPAALAAIVPGSVRVDVENGTGATGLAKRVADMLHAKGFAIGSIGDAARSDVARTQVHEHSPTTFAGFKVRQALGAAGRGARIIADTPPPSAAAGTPASDVTVVVGQDLMTGLAETTASQP